MSQTIAPRVVTKDSSSTCPPLIAHSCFRGRLRGLDCKFNNTAVIVIARYVLMSRHALGIDLCGRGYDGWTPAGRLVWRFPCPLPSPLTPTTPALPPRFPVCLLRCASVALLSTARQLRCVRSVRGRSVTTSCPFLVHVGFASLSWVCAVVPRKSGDHSPPPPPQELPSAHWSFLPTPSRHVSAGAR